MTAALLSAAALAARAEPPVRIEIAYEMMRNGSVMAEITEKLERADGNYQLTETWKGRGLFALLGSARRQSQGTLRGAKLEPREFFDERSGRDTARAWFDWKANTLTMQYKGEKTVQPMPPNAQDRLSFLLALSLLPGNSESIQYSIADGKGLSRHEYTVSGRERITLPAGEFDTVKVRRGGADPRESAEVWLAAERGYLPIRLLVIEKDGTRYDQVATRINVP
ncbi:MAG: DUF3108 domain-containing protein [Betaproteobacteria bacterium]